MLFSRDNEAGKGAEADEQDSRDDAKRLIYLFLVVSELI